MSEPVHKAIVIASQEIKVKGNAEPVLLKTWGPLCDPEGWAPGMQMDKRDERVTCEACLAKGKSDER
jgi:hypothetical protein